MNYLFHCLFSLSFAGVLLTVSPSAAQEFEKNILTGGPTGTYVQFGRDIASVAEPCGQSLNVRESAGSLENFLGVRQRRFTQFGIVQSDVLEYLRTFAANDPDIARAVAGVRIAFPLYDEEVHLLARREIADLGDLEGKRVAVGVQDSGTFLTASLVLDLTKVQPAEILTLGPDESLSQLLDGTIDAFFYVAGAPTKLFENPDIDGDQVHLVPITDATLLSVYSPATIVDGTYPFLDTSVDSIAVKAVLMTYDYDPQRNSYHRNSCNAVSDIVHVILTRFSTLQDLGHPKWQQVELNDIPPGWEVGNCVNIGLDTDYQLECRDEAMPTADTGGANAVYRDRICAVVGC